MPPTRDRLIRTCVRCGRTGTNAFRPIPTDEAHIGWMCTHQEPCVARMRTRHRSDARQHEGRPPTSPIAPPHVSERPACVIGSEAASVSGIADTLEEWAAVEVDRLDVTRRSLDCVSRRDYGLVIIDARAQDPVAYLNELARRLHMKRRRECSILVCHGADGPSPAVERLIRRLGAPSVRRPVDASVLMAAVTAGSDAELEGVVAG